ncbi:MAG: hypothetical protein ACOX83_02985 [Candidatus Spyradocola sp.]
MTSIRTVEGLWFEEIYHVTWIPWLVMGLAVIGCLALLGALRPLRMQSPWNYVPALVLGLLLCIGTSSPLVWIEFDSSRWNVPYTLVFVYALLAVEFARLLLRAEARKGPFAWKEAAKLVGLLALAYLPLLLSELGRTIGDALSTAGSREPLYTANKFRLAFYFLGGALGFLAARRGRRGAGAFLTALGAAMLVLVYLAYAMDPSISLSERLEPYNLPQWVEILVARAYEGLNYYVTMSGFGFVFFAGIKCLLPEKR